MEDWVRTWLSSRASHYSKHLSTVHQKQNLLLNRRSDESRLITWILLYSVSNLGNCRLSKQDETSRTNASRSNSRNTVCDIFHDDQ